MAGSPSSSSKASEEFFGSVILEARRKLGLQQRQLAVLVGISGHTVARWEGGRVPLRNLATVLPKLATVLELDEDKLWKLVEWYHIHSYRPSRVFLASMEKRQFAQDYLDLTKVRDHKVMKRLAVHWNIPENSAKQRVYNLITQGYLPPEAKQVPGKGKADVCAKGHPLTEDNVRISVERRSRVVRRQCKTCYRDYQREYKRAERARKALRRAA